MYKIPKLPEHWQSFFMSIIFLILLPMLPICLELLQTGCTSNKSLILFASVYSISISAATRSKLIFGLAIMGSIFFASLFGITTGSLPAYADFRLLSIIYISFLSLIHCGERWNRYLYEKKVFLQFLRKK